MRLILEEYTDGYTDQVKEIYKYGEEVPVKVEYRKPENAEDNIRIYVPLDINKQAVLRRLDWFIMRYSEANEIDFLIILGGPMSPNDDLDWIVQERKIISRTVTVKKKPAWLHRRRLRS